MYGLPYEYYEKYRVRRYGAHGTSHQFVAGVGAALAGLDVKSSKIITCHLGAGSSICAIQNGKCVDTSMGFSPLEGMIMGTRVGNIDANAVIYLENKLGVTPDEMSVILNRKSGFLGLSQYSSDARELNEKANSGDPKAKLVFKKFTYDIIKNIGSYVAAMNGVDLIVFTGSIGEHNSRLRRRVLENFSYLGLKVDYEANTASGEDAIITTEDSAVKAALICTNEELVIARDTMHLVLDKQ
jgi:acetate kinase